MNVHGERAEHVAANAIRKSVDALAEAEARLADDHALVLELLAVASALIEQAKAAVVEASGVDA